MQVLFASFAIAGRYVLPEFPAGPLVTVRVLLQGERLTPCATLAGLAIFAGLALVLDAERRQRQVVPISPG